MRNRSDHIHPWSEHDPTTHETVSHPSHSRGRSSTFVDALCMEKHRLSCICYLFKNAFRARLPPKLHRNSSTSTTCNPIYSEGTILELQITMGNCIGNSSTSTTCNPIYNAGNDPTVAITMEFCRPHMHEKQLKPHLQCGTLKNAFRARLPPKLHRQLLHSTTCNPIYSEGTISLTNSFPSELFLANSFFALSLTNSFFAISFFD